MDKVRQEQHWREISSKYLGVGNALTDGGIFVLQRQDQLALVAHHRHLTAYTAVAQLAHPEVTAQQIRRKIARAAPKAT